MNMNVLRYVEAVAEERSFTRAAERLYVAQPSLSQAIRALENELGAALFTRGGRAVALTPAGEKYLSWAKNVLRTEERMRADLSAAPGGLKKLCIGTSAYRSKALFPAAIRAFCQIRPNCRVELFERNQSDMMALLDEGKIDMIVDLPPAEGYQTALIAEERILFAVHRRFALPLRQGAEYPLVERDALLALPVIFINDAQYGNPLHLGPIQRRLFEDAGAVPDIAVQCCGAEMAHILAAEGLGFTVISELFMRSGALPELRYCEIASRPLKRRVCAIWSAARPLSADGAAFVELLQEQTARRIAGR